ncbi:type IV pilin protein [Thalassotalea aquiviva]|uniref:type IV pilin protein n=1 Tax=Thalassotalea aquiviva TaxID=3242415 RepID=UPI00352B445F
MNTFKLLGFTLIELLVSMAIFMLLLNIAYLGFNQYLIKVRRTEATHALLELAIAQQKYYRQHHHYSPKLSGKDSLGLASDVSKKGYYQLSSQIKRVTIDGYDGFIISAKAMGSQANDNDCKRFTLDHTLKKQAFNAADKVNNDCW